MHKTRTQRTHAQPRLTVQPSVVVVETKTKTCRETSSEAISFLGCISSIICLLHTIYSSTMIDCHILPSLTAVHIPFRPCLMYDFIVCEFWGSGVSVCGAISPIGHRLWLLLCVFTLYTPCNLFLVKAHCYTNQSNTSLQTRPLTGITGGTN
jgi:hypothetical protein